MPSPGGARPRFAAPAPLTRDHDVSEFRCGKKPMDRWLRRHALGNEGRGSRTFVICEGNKVVGYYALATGGEEPANVSPDLAENMPKQIPLLVLGRLAIDERYQKQGLGKALLKDALARYLGISREVGTRALLVHAIDEDAAGYYRQFGFQRFPDGSLTLFLSTEQIAAAL